MIPRAIAHYEVLEKAGEGGMGVVYKARDTHLNRFVAIKVLPAERVADPDRKRRFVQEARTASALNHPNIVTIYDIDTAGGVDFIAMEYVDGRTLEDLIGRKRLHLGEALKYAVQIADALARAHAAGITHRDLKPSNVMVDAHGLVKVLDFGLAKLTEPAGPEGATMTVRTAEGTIVGTVAYMSPEQAEGKDLDARSDIFSFGSLLYETLTGRRAFQGDSKLATLSAILHQEPAPLRTAIEDVPRELERIIGLCLRKTPERRIQHMEDVKVVLGALKEECDAGRLGESALPAPRARRRPPAWAALAALLLVGAGAGIAWWVARSPSATSVIMRRLTSDSGLTTDPALSPDGNLLAFASDRSGEGNLDIWVRHLAGGEPVRLTRHPADDHQPAFSPDGSKLVFRSERDGGGIYVIPALGGEERLIARQALWPRFSPDGSRIAFSGGAGAFHSPFIVPASGGSTQEFPAIVEAHRPVWSPDGKHLLLAGRDLKGPSQERFDWWVVPAEPGAPIKTGALLTLRRHSLDGPEPFGWVGNRIVFSATLGDSTNVWEVGISTGSFQIAGPPRRLTMGTEVESQPSLTAGGRLVFSTLSSNIDLWELPLDANHGKAAGAPRPLTQDVASDRLPSLSDDGRKLAFISTRLGNPDVWLRDLETGKETALTATPWEEDFAVIAHNGTRVIYRSTENRKRVIYAIATVGGVPEKVCEDCGAPTDWSRDGKRILLQYSFNEPQSTLGLLDLASGQKAEILKHSAYNVYRGHFSPDERWVVLHADNPRSGTRVFIAPFRGAAACDEREWIAVTDGAAFDDAPRWSPDGNLLYYLSDRDGFRCIWAQRLDGATKKPLGEAFAVQHLHSRQRSISSVPLSWLDLVVARDKLVFNIADLRGNIWAADFR